MKNYKKYLKILSLSLALAVSLLWPMTVNAQNYAYDDGLFGRGPKVKSYYDYSLFRDKMNGNTGGYLIYNQQFGEEYGGYNLYNQTFGQVVPLGNGWLILSAAGAGYAFRKRKNNDKNQKS